MVPHMDIAKKQVEDGATMSSISMWMTVCLMDLQDIKGVLHVRCIEV
jgi:hypothetical protein